jgi:hypothetical protein
MGKVLTNGEWRARRLRLWLREASKPTKAELLARAAKHFPGWELTGGDDLIIGVQFRTDAHADTVRAWCRENLIGEVFVSALGARLVVHCQLSSDAVLVRRRWSGEAETSEPLLSHDSAAAAE